MQTYIGYGFNVDDLKDTDWLRLMREHDGEEYECFVEDTKQNHGDGNLYSSLLDEVKDRIDSISSTAEYLRDIINDGERKDAGTNYIVSSYDNYLAFDCIRFADDSERAKYVRSEADFVQMIGRYVSVSELTFGNLYEGSEWLDPVYFLE